MVWSLAFKTPYSATPRLEILDGTRDSVRKVRYQNPEELGRLSIIPNLHPMTMGFRVIEEDVPHKLRWKAGKLKLPDLTTAAGCYIVSERLRALIEELEPGVHQFIPIELYRAREKVSFTRCYWFVVCSRIDSVNEEQTTFVFRGDRSLRVGFWNGLGDQSRVLVFDTKKIGNSHIWYDIYLSMGWTYISNEFHDALLGHGMKGWTGKQFDQV